jgi:hypothetical protein
VALFVEEENHLMIPILVQEILLMFVVEMFVVVDRLLPIQLMYFVMVVEDKIQSVVLLLLNLMEYEFEVSLHLHLIKDK